MRIKICHRNQKTYIKIKLAHNVNETYVWQYSYNRSAVYEVSLEDNILFYIHK